MLVLDTNVALAAAMAPGGLGRFAGEELVAPPLLWPEARSAISVAARRGQIRPSAAANLRDALQGGLIREHRPPELWDQVWELTRRLGWSKTYDAEFLAVAAIEDAPLLTFDRRVLAAGERLKLRVRQP